MECTIKLLIPCDGDKKLNINLKKEEILDRSTFLSPLFGYCTFNNVFNNFNTNEFFGLCGFSNERIYQMLDLDSFKPIEYFYPYGIILEGKFELKNIDNRLKKFNDFFSLRNISTSNADKKEKWDIKGYPIIVLEKNDCSKMKVEGLEDISDRPSVDEMFQKYGIELKNPIIVLSQVDMIPEDLYEDILDVLKVVCSIYFIARDVKMELSKKMEQLEKNKNNEKKSKSAKESKGHKKSKDEKKGKEDKEDKSYEEVEESLLKIQKKCALVKELSSSVIFRTNQQKRVYELIKDEFHIPDIIEQVDSVCNIIANCIEISENSISKKIEKKAYAMDKTVFITGYIGLILAVFSFFPLNFKNIFWIEISNIWGKVIAYVLIVLISIIICIILVHIYDCFLKCEKKSKYAEIIMWVITIVLLLFLLYFV